MGEDLYFTFSTVTQCLRYVILWYYK